MIETIELIASAQSIQDVIDAPVETTSGFNWSAPMIIWAGLTGALILATVACFIVDDFFRDDDKFFKIQIRLGAVSVVSLVSLITIGLITAEDDPYPAAQKRDDLVEAIESELVGKYSFDHVSFEHPRTFGGDAAINPWINRLTVDSSSSEPLVLDVVTDEGYRHSYIFAFYDEEIVLQTESSVDDSAPDPRKLER